MCPDQLQAPQLSKARLWARSQTSCRRRTGRARTRRDHGGHRGTAARLEGLRQKRPLQLLLLVFVTCLCHVCEKTRSLGPDQLGSANCTGNLDLPMGHHYKK